MATETDYSKLSPEDLVKLIQEKDTAIAQKDSELTKSTEIIGELKVDLAAKEEEILTASAVPTVKVAKDTYEIVIPTFKLFDKETLEIVEYTSRDVQKNDQLAALLVKMGSGVLRKVEKKK